MKLNARELRQLEPLLKLPRLKRNPIYFILENVYDTYNVGGLFRLADALAIEKIYLCGQTEIPPNHKIKKASIGTYKIVAWEYKRSAEEALNELRNSKSKAQNKKKLQVKRYKLQVVAVEQHPYSISYYKTQYQFPLALIFGNESFGISQEVLKKADQIVEIPMFGVNKSLNVIVSAAIVGYHILLTKAERTTKVAPKKE